VTPSVAAFEAAIRVKSMYMLKSWLKTRKERKHRNERSFYISIYPSKGGFKNGLHSLLRRADARGCADHIYRMCRGSGIVKNVTK